MKFGFIGSGNMAGALAVGLGEPALFSDAGSGRASRLAAATGGEALGVTDLALRSEAIFLAHKPAQLSSVAALIPNFEGVVVSLLAATPISELRRAYPLSRIVRAMPNIPVETGEGVIGLALESDPAPELDSHLERLGLVVRIPEDQFELFTAIAGCAPAFFALFSKEMVASAVRRGMPAESAAEIINQTMYGSALSLARNDLDSDALISRVASPGGLTERALESLEESGLSRSVEAAIATVLGK